MMRYSAVVCVMLLALLLSNAGCRDSSSNSANAPTNQARAGENANAPASPAQATQTPATPAATHGAGVLPITDAAAFRDRLLELAQGVKFDSQWSASSNADAIRAAWQRQYPELKFSLFYSMAADPNTVSSSDTFLISGAEGNYDQLYAFAVADASGRCAGGAAVIPGDSAKRSVSNEKVPTRFVPIEMSKAKSCTGEAAGEIYNL